MRTALTTLAALTIWLTAVGARGACVPAASVDSAMLVSTHRADVTKPLATRLPALVTGTAHVAEMAGLPLTFETGRVGGECRSKAGRWTVTLQVDKKTTSAQALAQAARGAAKCAVLRDATTEGRKPTNTDETRADDRGALMAMRLKIPALEYAAAVSGKDAPRLAAIKSKAPAYRAILNAYTLAATALKAGADATALEALSALRQAIGPSREIDTLVGAADLGQYLSSAKSARARAVADAAAALQLAFAGKQGAGDWMGRLSPILAVSIAYSSGIERDPEAPLDGALGLRAAGEPDYLDHAIRKLRSASGLPDEGASMTPERAPFLPACVSLVGAYLLEYDRVLRNDVVAAQSTLKNARAAASLCEAVFQSAGGEDLAKKSSRWSEIRAEQLNNSGLLCLLEGHAEAGLSDWDAARTLAPAVDGAQFNAMFVRYLATVWPVAAFGDRESARLGLLGPKSEQGPWFAALTSKLQSAGGFEAAKLVKSMSLEELHRARHATPPAKPETQTAMEEGLLAFEKALQAMDSVDSKQLERLRTAVSSVEAPGRVWSFTVGGTPNKIERHIADGRLVVSVVSNGYTVVTGDEETLNDVLCSVSGCLRSEVVENKVKPAGDSVPEGPQGGPGATAPREWYDLDCTWIGRNLLGCKTKSEIEAWNRDVR